MTNLSGSDFFSLMETLDGMEFEDIAVVSPPTMKSVSTQTTLSVDVFYRNKLLKLKSQEIKKNAANIQIWKQWVSLLNEELDRVSNPLLINFVYHIYFS